MVSGGYHGPGKQVQHAPGPLIATIINSDNPLIKYGLSSLIIFGSLYFLATLNVPGTTLIAGMIALGFAINIARTQQIFRI